MSPFHEGPLPRPESETLHEDGQVYRLAAIRETFEESGILLARKKDGSLLELSYQAREEGRKAIHGNSIKFTDWLASAGGVPDTGRSLKLIVKYRARDYQTKDPNKMALYHLHDG